MDFVTRDLDIVKPGILWSKVKRKFLKFLVRNSCIYIVPGIDNFELTIFKRIEYLSPLRIIEVGIVFRVEPYLIKMSLASFLVLI